MTPLYVIGFLSSLGFSIVIPFLVFLVTRFGGNAFVLGAIGAAFSAAQFFGSSWLGPLSDRIGRKRVLVRCQIGALAAWAIFLVAVYIPRTALFDVDTGLTGAFTLTVPLLLIALSRVTDGLFNGSVSVANAYVADATSGPAQKVAFGRLAIANNLGFVTGPALAGLIARTNGGIVVIVATALLLSASAAALAKFRLPEATPTPTPDATPQTTAVLGTGCRAAVKHPPSRWRLLFDSRELLKLIAIYFLVFLGFSMFASTLPVHAEQDLHWQSSELGILFTVLAGALVVTEWLLLPWFAKHVRDAWLGAVGSLIVAISYALMATHSSIALYTGAVCYGVGNGLSWPSYLAMLARSGSPSQHGMIQGIGSSAGSIASVVGMLASGVMFEAIGASTFFISAGALAITTAIFFTSSDAD
ncbi:MAG: MFS transporter [Kofleriaceae bacterium]